MLTMQHPSTLSPHPSPLMYPHAYGFSHPMPMPSPGVSYTDTLDRHSHLAHAMHPMDSPSVIHRMPMSIDDDLKMTSNLPLSSSDYAPPAPVALPLPTPPSVARYLCSSLPLDYPYFPSFESDPYPFYPHRVPFPSHSLKQQQQQQHHHSLSSPSLLSSSPPPPPNSLYKTELCRPYEETGECRYGTKCQFAHGRHELRNVHRHPKYKTEICKTFSSIGNCPYGRRCRFLHRRDGGHPHPVVEESDNEDAFSSSQPVQEDALLSMACLTTDDQDLSSSSSSQDPLEYDASESSVGMTQFLLDPAEFSETSDAQSWTPTMDHATAAAMMATLSSSIYHDTPKNDAIYSSVTDQSQHIMMDHKHTPLSCRTTQGLSETCLNLVDQHRLRIFQTFRDYPGAAAAMAASSSL